MLRWDIPVETRDVSVPFELKDLDLPIGPAHAPEIATTQSALAQPILTQTAIAATQPAHPVWNISVDTAAGPFQLKFAQNNLYYQINYGIHKTKETNVLFWAKATWGPDVCVLDAPIQKWVESCVDERGNALKRTRDHDLIRDGAFPSESVLQSISSLSLETSDFAPPDNIGDRIATLRGLLQPAVQTKSKLIQIASIAGLLNQPNVFGPNSMTIKKTALLEDGISQTFEIEFTGPITRQPLSTLHGILAQMQFTGDRGKKWLDKETRGDNDRTDQPYVTFVRTDGPSDHLIWQTPLEITTVSIPFELHDIPLGK